MAYGQYGYGHNAGPGQPSSSSATQLVPDVPGTPADEMTQTFLRDHVNNLTGLFGKHRFPGAQPVSFTKSSLDLLHSEDFWVCEKSDGQRVLVLIVVPGMGGAQEVYLIDRKNNYFLQKGLFFPHGDQQYYTRSSHTADQKAQVKAKVAQDGLPYLNGWPGRKDTLLDGELVWDTEKATGIRRLRLLLFDALVVDGVNMSKRPLSKRYGRLHSMIFKPFSEYLRQQQIPISALPFEVKIKKMDLAYGIDAVLSRMPHLEHGNDGLIFTGMHSGYTFGTDEKIIKWKPPHENSIDFKLKLLFPPDPRVENGRVPDLKAKPFFLLEEFMGNNRYEKFDWAWVDDDQWQKIKESGVQYDERIVECVWSPTGGPLLPNTSLKAPGWKIHRIRDDKKDGNHHTIVDKIITSIEDGVEEKQVVSAVGSIRDAWKSESRSLKRKQIEMDSTHTAHNGGTASKGRTSGPRPLPVGPVGVVRL
ncbi:unnamed protein product [Sympodiomycopsis kandeliae]